MLSLPRVRAILPLLLLFLLLKACALADEQSDEEKRKQFLRAREEMKTLPLTPAPETTPKPKPKPVRPASTPLPAATPSATPKPAPPKPPEPEVTPRPKPEATPKSKPKSEPEATPRPRQTMLFPAGPTPTPARAPVSAPVVIEKSGFEQQRNYEPAPAAGWFEKWKYLSKSVRNEIDRAPVLSRRWRYIVVHNSGTRQGNAKAFDYYHLHVRKMPNGLAYHFVIGNGTSTGDGEVEIGNRWKRQINGGHVHSDYLNNIALGICLVGDFNRDVPTKAQLESLEELIKYLRRRLGRVGGQYAVVWAHKNINPPRWPTDCPGGRFPVDWLDRKF